LSWYIASSAALIRVLRVTNLPPGARVPTEELDVRSIRARLIELAPQRVQPVVDVQLFRAPWRRRGIRRPA